MFYTFNEKNLRCASVASTHDLDSAAGMCSENIQQKLKEHENRRENRDVSWLVESYYGGMRLAEGSQYDQGYLASELSQLYSCCELLLLNTFCCIYN